MTYAIQFISAPALMRARGCPDAGWQTHYDIMGVDYTRYGSVDEATRQLELDADGAYRYRIVEVASVDESYAELQAENLDALDALAAWFRAGCPNSAEHIEALRRAAAACAKAAPVTVVRAATSNDNHPGEEREAS